MRMRFRRKAALFLIILAVGDIVGFGTTAYFVSLDRAYDAVAILTAVITAGYSIIQDEAQRAKPLLRASLRVVAGWGLGSVGLELQMTNIGGAIANGVRGKFTLQDAEGVALNGGGSFSAPAIAPRETATARLIDSVSTPSISPASFSGTIDYEGGDGERMKQIKLNGRIQTLIDEMTRDLMNR